jgi:hypothetical protein
MFDTPKATFLPTGAMSDLLAQASAILTREVARLPWSGQGLAPAALASLASAPGARGEQLASAATPVGAFTDSSIPSQPFDTEALRRQARELMAALTATLNEANGDESAPYQDQVPLLCCAAPANPGTEASAVMNVANDEDTPSQVTLYASNFIADSGYEIPSLRMNVSPRSVTIPAKSQAAFEIKIAVPQQTPPGIYSGLIQAMGSKYVKAVLSVEVL